LLDPALTSSTSSLVYLLFLNIIYSFYFNVSVAACMISTRAQVSVKRPPVGLIQTFIGGLNHYPYLGTNPSDLNTTQATFALHLAPSYTRHCQAIYQPLRRLQLRAWAIYSTSIFSTHRAITLQYYSPLGTR
jgi:hypothetical protein